REAHFRWMQNVVWTTNDSYRVVLRDVEGMVGDIAMEIWNKLTTFYWLQSAQTSAPHAHKKSCMSGGTFAAIFEQWHRSSVYPNIEFGHFFAAPVRITATGPSSLPQILKAHSSLCAQAQHISLDMDNYSVHPFLPAVVLVYDRVTGVGCGPDSYVSLREVARTQTVLVILTGTNRTSTGIHVTLDRLKPFALPIERADATGLDILRVPLDITIDFVIELEGSINAQKETSGRTLDTSLCHHQTPVGYYHDIAGNKNWVQKAVGYEICCHARSRTPFRTSIKLRTRTPALQPEVETLNSHAFLDHLFTWERGTLSVQGLKLVYWQWRKCWGVSSYYTITFAKTSSRNPLEVYESAITNEKRLCKELAGFKAQPPLPASLASCGYQVQSGRLASNAENSLQPMLLSCVILISNSTLVNVTSADAVKNQDSAYSNWFNLDHRLMGQDGLAIRSALAMLEGHGVRSWKAGFRSIEYTRHDNGFYAILGTPNRASTMRMLRDHQTELGHRIVEKIVVFSNKNLTMKMAETWTRYYKNCVVCLVQLLQILRDENESHLNLAQPGLTVFKLVQAEIDLYSRIVKNVCGEHVYCRFKFDGFFHSLAGTQQFTVWIDGEDALYVFIARSLLQALCERKEETYLEPLREHAAIWFYEYVKHFVEKLDYFEPDCKHLSIIDAKLSCVLYDMNGIDLWLST
ncbi:hypothetical protein IAQ61_003269, partial [Plenodomus lingam]|uniref:uncharacterized protein n=1 Tax=Leptosphaeria maculans TaxID=5022 RepID=UPI00331916A9